MKKVLSLCVMCLLTLSAMSQKTVWVDLDLPSGTKWKSVNENGYYTYDDAIDNFGKYVPTKEQWQELRTFCVWTWQEDGHRVTGNNGNSIFLTAAAFRNSDGEVHGAGTYGYYWSATESDYSNYYAYCLYFRSDYEVYINDGRGRGYRFSVRLVQ